MLIWPHGFYSKGNAIYISEPLSQFRYHAGQQTHNKSFKVVKISHTLVITAKEYGFLQNTTDYRATLLSATNGVKVP